MAKNSILQEHKDELFKCLYRGKDLTKLLETAYKYINNPIIVCDTSYSVLGSFPQVSDERNLEIQNNRLRLKNVFAQDMEINKITERIYHSIYPFITKVEVFPYDWVFESIRINQAVVGYICIRGYNRNFNDEDLDLIHYLTQSISIQLQKNVEYTNPHGIKYDYFYKELFLNHYDNEANIKNQLKLLGVTPSENYYIIGIDFIENTDKILSPNYYCQQIMSIFTNSVTGIYNGVLVTLVPTSFLRPYNEQTRERLITFLSTNNMVAAVSFVFTNLMESSLYFNQCQSMLNMIEPAKDAGRILLYGDYCFRHIASIIDNPSILISAVHPALKYMKAYDENNGTEYLNTLDVYLQKNRSAPAAAVALHIHKSTFFYRLEKMKSLFGIDITSSDDMFAYEVSMRLMNVSHLI